MKKIAIIHPEGNINNNPNLTGIVEILCENDYEVDVYSPKRPEIYQKAPCEGSNLFLEDSTNIEELEKILRYKYAQPYFLILGIDTGIVEAEILSKILDVPYGLISYEIYFADELGCENKKIEISACQNINFAIIQDEIRGKLLSNENGISPEKYFYIPVAGRGKKKRIRQYYWHKKFNIPIEKKIAVYMGAIQKWAMVDEIIEYASTLNNDWNIIIHDRYGHINLDKNYVKLIESTPNVYLSNDTFNSFESMQEALFSSDLGLAFYNPIKGNKKYTGKNIQYIGLSSGKISTYLQHGVPIATNKNYPIADYIDKYDIGFWVENIQELAVKLNNIKECDLAENCISFFDEYLNLDKTIVKFLHHLKTIEDSGNKSDNKLSRELLLSNILYINQEVIQPLIYKNQRIAKDNEILMNVNLMQENIILKYQRCLSYRLGNFLIKPFSYIKQKLEKLRCKA